MCDLPASRFISSHSPESELARLPAMQFQHRSGLKKSLAARALRHIVLAATLLFACLTAAPNMNWIWLDEMTQRAQDEPLPRISSVVWGALRAPWHLAAATARLAAGQGGRVTRLVAKLVMRKEEATAAELTGVMVDSAGGLNAFWVALLINSLAVLVLTLFFEIARGWHPLVYVRNEVGETRPSTISRLPCGWLAWLPTVINLTVDDVAGVVGLDAAMLLEFHHLALQILAVVGVPLIVVLCPLHYYFGGMADADQYSRLGMGNVAQGSSLCWLHAGVVWFVVLSAEALIFRAQRRFLDLRVRWLREMPVPRATTVMVEHIPAEYQSDKRLQDYIDNVFARTVVKEAYVIKKTGQLLKLEAKLASAKRELMELDFQWQRSGSIPERRPILTRASNLRRARKRDDFLYTGLSADTDLLLIQLAGDQMDGLDYFQKVAADTAALVQEERKRILEVASSGITDRSTGEVHSSSGFITFIHRRDAEIALQMTFRSHGWQFVMSRPPDPGDVLYSALLAGEAYSFLGQCIGYAAIAGLFLGYVPFIVLFSAVAQLETLRKVVPLLESIVQSWPVLHTVWNGLMASFALTLFMSFLPSCLMLISRRLFVLKAGRWCQLKLQMLYYYFLVVFVLLITAVGSSIFCTASNLVERPVSIFSLLASTMPKATQFYLCYFPLQWTSYVLELVRYQNLAKFVTMLTLCGQVAAKERSEPENQDYYGIGARSARDTLLLVIALVFCSLSPPICLVASMSFVVARVCYGYLLFYAEVRKPDQGGEFWCLQLQHLQHGLFIYVILMTGVLLQRASTSTPGVLAATSLFALASKYRRFHTEFKWQSLPFEDISQDLDHRKETSSRHSYVQPELCGES
eukprot:TRINITY_DN28044_c0_g1_i1.p1 TRINITY_DN28044_c0_g1~~TRINITY_DN28044_c0_g1_i1.p1  ORF type:complete len:862 (+),score=124.99 TRINITY_DN28044_c0_g1_i1:35-2620(+)